MFSMLQQNKVLKRINHRKQYYIFILLHFKTATGHAK